jgi:hypothetical protein
MGGLLARSCRNRDGANERKSSTKGSTESLGILAQTVSTARHGARTLWGSFSAGPGKTCCRNKRQQEEPPVGLEAGSQLKSQGKWLGVGGTFLWDFTYLCWNLTIAGKSPPLFMRVPGASDRRNSRQNNERTQKQEKRGSGRLRQAACSAICLVSAEIGVHRLQLIAPEVMETFSPASCPASYALESK